MTTLTSEQVWQAIQQNIFAVLGMVTTSGEARTVGIVYCAVDRKFYISSKKDAWKIKYIRDNPHVSITIPIHKSIPLIPWIKIPAATITFSGVATVLENSEVGPGVLKALYRGIAQTDEILSTACTIQVVPQGNFLTYGVGMPMLQMRDTERARGRVPIE